MNISVVYNSADPFDGDLEISNNQLVLTSGQEEIRQFSIQNLKTFLGEWFLDTTIGIPYREGIFAKGNNPDAIEAIFINAILSTLGVVRLLELNLDIPNLATRELELDYRAETLDSIEPIVVNVQLP